MFNEKNTATDNSGDRNSGDGNSGDRNSGDRNSGDGNSGDGNRGHGNSGDWNSGDGNSGDGNRGHGNSGDWNSGDGNSGDGNRGNWNACDYETGYFNTAQSNKIRVFNKDCDREAWEKAEKPKFIYFDLCVWVYESDMTDEQKKNDPDFHIRGGQLQTKDYKQAWKDAYDNASSEDIELLKALPNFDADVFEELTGIRVDDKDMKNCEGRIVEIDGIQYELKKLK